jgi:hypothetical protein
MPDNAPHGLPNNLHGLLRTGTETKDITASTCGNSEKRTRYRLRPRFKHCRNVFVFDGQPLKHFSRQACDSPDFLRNLGKRA